MKWLLSLLLSLAFICVSSTVAWSAPATLRVLGNFSGNKKQVEVERPFFENLSENTGIPMRVTYMTLDEANVKAADAFRLLKSGVFDVASVQIGIASRDDALLGGIDLAGVATTVPEQRKVVKAFRGTFDDEAQSKFNTKTMTLWPFGPQILFCKSPTNELADFKGRKVRSFTTSMSNLIKGLGAEPVSLQYGDAYLALQRGVVDCGVTAAAAGNGGKWPEVTSNLVPLPVSNAMQGHFMSLKTWKKFTPEEQEKLKKAFADLEKKMWNLAQNINDDAIACNTGQDSCKGFTKYDMTLDEIDPSMEKELKKVVRKKVLPKWGRNCNESIPNCTKKWNETVGEAMGYEITP